MPAVDFEMTAEEGDVLRALLNVVQGQKKLEEQTRRNTEASENWGKVSQEAMAASKQKGMDWQKTVEGIAGALGAALTAMKAFADFSEQRLDVMKQKAEGFQKKISEIDQALSSSGEISLLPEIDSELSGIRSREMNQQQIRELFSFASNEGAGEFSAQEIVSAVKEGVAARSAGKDAKAFTSTYLALKDAGFEDDASGSVSDKVTELMDAFRDGLGEGEKKFLGQVPSSGMDRNDALRFLLASKQSDQGSKVLQQVMNVANQDFTESQLKPSRQTTPEQQAELDRIKARQLAIDKERLSIDEQIAAKPWRKRVLEKDRDGLALEDQRLSVRAREIEAAAPMGLTPEQERWKRLSGIKKGGERFAEIVRSPDLLGDEKAPFMALMDSINSEAFSGGGAFGFDIQQRQSTINKDTKFRLMAEKKAMEIDEENRKLNPSVQELMIDKRNREREIEDQKIIEKGGVKGALMSFSKALGMDRVNRNIEAGADMNKSAAQMSTSSSEAGQIVREMKDLNSKVRSRPAVSRPPGGAERDPAEGF